MVNLNCFFWNFLFFFLYIYIEVFYSIVFFSVFKNLKFFSLSGLKKLNFYIFKNNFFYFVLYLLFIYLFTLKVSFLNNNVISCLFIFLLLSGLLNRYISSNVMFLNFNILFFLFFIMFVNSLIIFFLFIELYSILFYFFFLNYITNNSSLTVLKFKNNLLLYLFNNFFSTILFLLGINFLVESFGTVQFSELCYLNNLSVSWKSYLIVLSFLLKLSLPTLHYLKLEVYKYLDINIVILFSITTIFLYFFFTIFFFSHSFILNLLVHFKLLNIFLILGFFFLLQKLKVSNFQEFIAYSGFATNNLIILTFLI